MRRTLALVAAVALVAHVLALRGGFVWLDHAHLEEGRALAPPGGLVALFGQGFAGTGYYRPLVALMLSLDAAVARVAGGGPLVFHAASIAWHAVAACLVVVAGRGMGATARGAALGGVLFAVHPVAGVVASVVAFRPEPLALAALLGLVAAHAARRPVLAGALALAAGLAKETSFVLAPLFLAASAWTERRPPAGASKAQRTVVVAEALGLLIALGLRAAFAPPWRGRWPELGAGAQVGTRLASLARAVATIAFPADRSVCDVFPVTSLGHPTALAGGAVALALVVAAATRRGPALFLALALLPVLQLVPVPRWWSVHYLYVPLAPAALLAGDALARFDARGRLAAAALGTALAAVGVLDARRFVDDDALFAPEVARRPACLEAHAFLGDAAAARGALEVAARHYEASLATPQALLAYVDRRAALQDLGVVRARQGRFAEARRAFAEALTGTRDDAARRELVHDLARATLEAGDPAGAARLLEPEVARPDALPASLALFAAALDADGRHRDAEAARARLRR